MTEKEKLNQVVRLVKAYMDMGLFKSEDEYERMAGWKLHMTMQSAHLYTTVGWSLVDIRLDDKYKAGLYVEALKSAGLPESALPLETFLKVVGFYNSGAAMERTENFKQAVMESTHYVIMPDNSRIDTRAVKPLAPFLEDVVEYRLVRTVQMVFCLQNGAVHLHIAPLSADTKVSAVKVNPYSTDTEDCGGLFF